MPTDPLAAAVAVGRSLGLPVDRPRVLSDAYTLVVHLAPAPVVARVPTLRSAVRTPVAPWLARELAVADWLAAAGAPVVPPTDLVDPGPHHHGDAVVSLWRHVPHDRDADLPTGTTGAMLGDLHRALRDCPVHLTVLAGPRHDVPTLLPRLPGRLDDAGIALLHRAWERLRPGPDTSLQPLHGDVHPGNLLASAAGPVWTDLEETCRGPVAWDLAGLFLRAPRELAGYPAAPSPADLRPWVLLRRLQVACWLGAGPPPPGVGAVQRRHLLAAALADLAVGVPG